MADEYTPTTEHVRNRFINHQQATSSSLVSREESGEMFDRWLSEIRRDQAEKDAQIAEESDPGWDVARSDGLTVAQAIHAQFTTPSTETDVNHD